MPEKDDNTLIGKIAYGDRQAFNALVDRYYESLCAFSYRIVGSYQAAEDVVQDSLINMWLNRKNIAGSSFGKTYLYAIVKNSSLAHLRADARRDTLRVMSDTVEKDVSHWFIEQETFRMVAEAIALLPPRTAEVIRLSLEGVRQEEIGRRMGITVATVKALKTDGIKKLRKTVGQTTTILLFILM